MRRGIDCRLNSRDVNAGVSFSEYLSKDHDRLDALLTRSTAKPGVIDMEPYSEFRKGILRHISMEEKIVLPAIARWQGGQKAALAERLRLDHGAIVSLLVPPPSPSIVLTLRSIFAVHNPLEEQKGGLYELLDSMAGPETEKSFANSSPRRPYRYSPITRNRRQSKRPDLQLRERATNYGIRRTGVVNCRRGL